MYYEHERRVAPVDETVRATWPPVFTKDSGWKLMEEYLEERGLCYRTAVSYGWYPSMSAGDTALRVVIPCVRQDSHVYWQARLITPCLNSIVKRYQSPRVARKDAVVYMGYKHEVIDRLVIVEGPMDALAVAEFDGTASVAIMGNNPPQSVIDHIRCIIKGMQPSVVLLVADSDSLEQFVKIKLALGGKPMIVSPQPHSDLAEIPRVQRNIWLADASF